MNFNFKEILEMFSGHWRFLTFLVLVGALVGAFVFVPVVESYFGSERRSCGKCLDENDMLLSRIIEISALVREYEYMKAKEEELLRSIVVEASEEIDITQPDTVGSYNRAVVNKSKMLTLDKDSIIDKIERLSKIEQP